MNWRVSTVVAILILAPFPTAAGQDIQGLQTQATGQSEDFLLETSQSPQRGEARIRFQLGPRLFEQGGGARVSLRVFNILRQVVGVPVLLAPDGRPAEPVEDLLFERPGSFEAYWDGLDLEGHEATAGPYFVELMVGGRSQVRKILLIR